MNKKLNISFFNQSIDDSIYKFALGDEFLEKDKDITGQERKGTWWVNPAMLYLKMYYDKNSNFADCYEWHQIYPRLPSEGIADHPEQIIENKTDILCIGLYTWTTPTLEKIITKVKEKLPNIIILAGGPDVAVHNDPAWLLDRPWIDYCVYGDGQTPLTNLLDCFAQGIKPTKDSITNTAWVDDLNGLVVTPNEIFRDKEFFSRGPWWHGRKYVKEWIQHARQMGYGLQVNFETSRSCPYNCSFCDWTSGLHNKVSKWSLMSTFKDFAFLAQHGVQSFRMSDANFGQWAQDLDIAKFVVKLRNKYGKNILNQCETNWSKMKKDRAFEIMNLWLESGMYSSSVFSYSFQDLDQKVLQAIDRPEIPWEEHRAYIVNQRNKFPEIRSQAEFIAGLPYQTVEGMLYNTNEAYKLGSNAIWYTWQYLANAPVRNENYRKKYDIHIHDWNIPFSVVEKEKNELPNFVEYKLCWSHVNGLDEALVCFLLKWTLTTFSEGGQDMRDVTGPTYGEDSDFLDRLLTIFDNKLYNIDFIQSFASHVKSLMSGQTKDAYIETDDLILNIFHLSMNIVWYDPDRLEELGGVDFVKYKDMSEKEKIALAASLIREQFNPQKSTLTAPQIHYSLVD